MNKDRFLAVICLTVLSFSLVFAATQTSSLGLYKFTVGDLDYPANQNSNMDILDAAILDKQAGGTITGDLAVTGTITASVAAASGTVVGGVTMYGAKTGAEIQALVCPDYCTAFNTDENAVYESTGTSAGQFRNSRTGTGPKP